MLQSLPCCKEEVACSLPRDRSLMTVHELLSLGMQACCCNVCGELISDRSTMIGAYGTCLMPPIEVLALDCSHTYTHTCAAYACCRAESSTSGCSTFTCSVLDKGMQTIQESLQAEYDELYEHYQVSSHCMHLTTCIVQSQGAFCCQ